MQPTATESSSVPKRYTAPIVFGILELPFGAAVGFLQVAVPFWLAAQGVPLEDIAAISATGFMPHALKIFWVPALDIGNYRRRWYAVMAVGTAAFLFASAAFPDPVHHLGWYTVILTLAQVTASTLSSAVDALMATSAEPAQKGRVGGYKMAGNVGGTALLGVVPIWLARQFTPLVAGVFLAGIVLACAVGIFFVFEHKVVASVGDAVGTFFAKSMRLLRSFAADLWTTAKSREGWTGLLICAAPVGCGALVNLFAAMANDYSASSTVVESVNGLAGGVVSAAGSILGGYICDRINRRAAYCLAGGVTALASFAMALAPMNQTTYTWGCLIYMFANGAAFAAFVGMVLEMVSQGAAVATKYALFVAVSNQAISYVTYLDGQASKFHDIGVRGAIWFDGILTIAGIVVVVVMVVLVRRLKPVPMTESVAA